MGCVNASAADPGFDQFVVEVPEMQKRGKPPPVTVILTEVTTGKWTHNSFLLVPARNDEGKYDLRLGNGSTLGRVERIAKESSNNDEGDAKAAGTRPQKFAVGITSGTKQLILNKILGLVAVDTEGYKLSQEGLMLVLAKDTVVLGSLMAKPSIQWRLRVKADLDRDSKAAVLATLMCTHPLTPVRCAFEKPQQRVQRVVGCPTIPKSTWKWNGNVELEVEVDGGSMSGAGHFKVGRDDGKWDGEVSLSGKVWDAFPNAVGTLSEVSFEITSEEPNTHHKFPKITLPYRLVCRGKLRTDENDQGFIIEGTCRQLKIEYERLGRMIRFWKGEDKYEFELRTGIGEGCKDFIQMKKQREHKVAIERERLRQLREEEQRRAQEAILCSGFEDYGCGDWDGAAAGWEEDYNFRQYLCNFDGGDAGFDARFVVADFESDYAKAMAGFSNTEISDGAYVPTALAMSDLGGDFGGDCGDGGGDGGF